MPPGCGKVPVDICCDILADGGGAPGAAWAEPPMGAGSCDPLLALDARGGPGAVEEPADVTR